MYFHKLIIIISEKDHRSRIYLKNKRNGTIKNKIFTSEIFHAIQGLCPIQSIEN